MRTRGVAHRSELSSLGITDKDRRRMLRRGEMTRAGTFYVTAEAPANLLPLLGKGVRPTCLTAAALHELWTPLHSDTHIYRPRGVVAGALEKDWIEHGVGLRGWPDALPFADIALTLDHAARCLPVRDAAILFESAVHRRKISLHVALQIIEGLPQRIRTPLRRIDPRAESGTETAVRWWLESLRVPVTPQVQIPGVGRVDLQVGRSWVIECDSVRYHDNPEQYHEDRRRDLLLRSRRYTVTRLTWEQVFLQEEDTRRELLRCIQRRDHRRRLPH